MSKMKQALVLEFTNMLQQQQHELAAEQRQRAAPAVAKQQRYHHLPCCGWKTSVRLLTPASLQPYAGVKFKSEIKRR
eukprot:SAG11_NODE_103_length_16571_cov_49.569208_14_plen_77_part_00